MSMFDATATEVPTEPTGVAAEAVASTEQVEAPPAVSESTAAPEVPAGPTYTVKVNGEDRQVTVDELQKGFMLQADYTRKTQELADSRQRLTRAEAIMSALEANPTATLQALAESFGMPLGATSPESEEYVDPEELRIRNLEQQVGSWEESQRQAEIDRTINALHDQYGEFDDVELLTHAIQNGIGSLDVAYAHWAFPQLQTQASARQTAAQQAAAQEAAVTEAKRAAGTLVEGGAGTAAGTVSAGAGKVNSVRDAWEKAKQQLGI